MENAPPGSKKHTAVVHEAIAKLNCPLNGGYHPHSFLDKKGNIAGVCLCGIDWQTACAATRVLQDFAEGKLVVAA